MSIPMVEYRVRIERISGVQFASGYWQMPEAGSAASNERFARQVTMAVRDFVENAKRDNGVLAIYCDQPTVFHLPYTVFDILMRYIGEVPKDSKARFIFDEPIELPWEDEHNGQG